MKVVYLTEPGTMEIAEEVIPEVRKGCALVRIEYNGICGSDVHFYKDGRVGDCVLHGPFVLGHEVSGTVTEVGEGVTELKAGDRVALEPGYACGKCEFCKSGRYNLCPDVKFFAAPPVRGALQEYVVHPADMCFKLPGNVSTMEGALVEPLAVGLHAASLGEVSLGQSVVILGAGCIGLVTLLAAKARGAANIVVADLHEKRLEYARQMGATHTVNAGGGDAPAKIMEILEGGPDVVFETAGSPVTIAQTAHIVRRGGTIVLVGMSAQSEVNYNFFQVMEKEAVIKCVFRYRNLYPKAIAAISGGSINVKQIVTHTFTLEEAGKAFETVVEDAQNVVKGIIKM
ncbi:NAD(P)-dependent alcohol dehydrogenase [[Clostridium] hylemonae]|uniref:Chlorophyll synthesis pathway protein BchC n=1 Tax=[Clostridium] hylemonae DSM 15053 TaxID=553973 RepID=C0C0Z4_9FIRM|nr:NAD(P)-dependent alcohol dehydrogenase [[Clostridium] hylemonae]EEG73808.1 putative chlorophyll synthesis pathway protein BchC [[Clostridium] hylemonae DSM 15053]QEK19190.1 Sorbitol dehydrogenase [[Clostridium] hylemonae DSM 15053]